MVSSRLFALMTLGLVSGTLSMREQEPGDAPKELLPRQMNMPELATKSCLESSVIQLASNLTGQERGLPGVKAGQTQSAKDGANFIAFCFNQTLTNGTQNPEGSCNPIPMGKIPAIENMISTVILHPATGQALQANTTFNITIQTSHLSAGLESNPTASYFTAPQDLDDNGDVKGHCHVMVQDIGNMTTRTPPDPTKTAYFKAIDDAGDGNGRLQVTVEGGLGPGVYRVCTSITAQNHQPVMMPVANKGAQDDCVRFTVRERAQPRDDTRVVTNTQRFRRLFFDPMKKSSSGGAS